MTKKNKKKKIRSGLFARIQSFLDSQDERLTEEIGRDEEPEPVHESKLPAWGQSVESLASGEIRFFEIIYPIAATLLALFIIVVLIATASQLPRFGGDSNPALNEVTDRYLEKGMEETGAVNLVTGIILDYRAFDTLGESHVLFTAAIAVLVLLFDAKAEKQDLLENKDFDLTKDSIFREAIRFLLPVILLFGIYVIMNGHLSPGGGFSGGAILGAGLMLHALAFGFKETEKIVNRKSYSAMVVCALCFYSLSKAYSFFTGANGMHSIISAGTPGRIFSAGLILPLNVAVGLVVACTMYGFFSLYKRGRI